MRRAKVDANQPEIVAAFRERGATVAHTHTVGAGFPDIVVGYEGANHLIEIKDGSKPPSARKLTADEAKFHAEWGGQIGVIESVEDVEQMMSVLKAARGVA